MQIKDVLRIEIFEYKVTNISKLNKSIGKVLLHMDDIPQTNTVKEIVFPSQNGTWPSVYIFMRIKKLSDIYVRINLTDYT